MCSCLLQVFDNHRVEMVAFVVLSNCYQKEFPGLPPNDGKDPRGISFARYVIWSCEVCRMKDYEMIDLFMKVRNHFVLLLTPLSNSLRSSLTVLDAKAQY